MQEDTNPMPPRLRHGYLDGRCGHYLAATLAQIDTHLRALRVEMQSTTPLRAANLRHDIDLLLERRHELEN